jgi:hypothetical protein
MTRPQDELQCKTKCFKPVGGEHDGRNMETEPEREDEDGLRGAALDAMLCCFNTEAAASNNDQAESFDTGPLRRKGIKNWGYKSLAEMSHFPTDTTAIWESISVVMPMLLDLTVDVAITRQKEPEQRQIGTILLQRTSRRAKRFLEIARSSEEIHVLEANGSIQSILDWATKAQLDSGQC